MGWDGRKKFPVVQSGASHNHYGKWRRVYIRVRRLVFQFFGLHWSVKCSEEFPEHLWSRWCYRMRLRWRQDGARLFGNGAELQVLSGPRACKSMVWVTVGSYDLLYGNHVASLRAEITTRYPSVDEHFPRYSEGLAQRKRAPPVKPFDSASSSQPRLQGKVVIAGAETDNVSSVVLSEYQSKRRQRKSLNFEIGFFLNSMKLTLKSCFRTWSQLLVYKNLELFSCFSYYFCVRAKKNKRRGKRRTRDTEGKKHNTIERRIGLLKE